jgi:hypothetical protein
MSAVCPRCQKAVPLGYVRCPDRTCRALLGRTAARTTGSPGGTVAKASPLGLIVVAGVGVVALVLVIWLFARGTSTKKNDTAAAGSGQQEEGSAEAGEASATPAAARFRTVPRADTVFDQNPTPAQPSAPDPRAAAAELERALRRQRLWSTVEVFGERADIRSNVCADAGLQTAVTGATSALRTAGLTRLRCLEQSGRVVFTRDL